MSAVERFADNILRAAGSSLRHYTMPATRQAILDATAEAMDEAADTITDLLAAGMAVWNNVLNGDIECHTGQAAASLTTLKEAIARAKGGAA